MRGESLPIVRVPLGQLFITRAAKEELNREDVFRALEQHRAGDWGEVGAEDWKANDRALVEGTRLLSAYWDRGKHRFWIITEADRAITTVLLPDDY